MTEPFYVNQTHEPDKARQGPWLLQCSKDAKAMGATWVRCGYHPDNESMIIVEAWYERPQCEGEQRWSSFSHYIGEEK